MIRDSLFKLIGVPLLALVMLFTSGLHQRSALAVLACLAFFLAASFLCWQLSLTVLSRVRNGKPRRKMPVKLLLMCGTSALLSALAAEGALFLMNLCWPGLRIGEPGSLVPEAAAGLMGVCALVYEILFLEKERQIDNQIVRHLDKELMHAEIHVLRNELDPHFVYNSLMPLYYLVKNDTPKAEAFACKLIQVYQYFLENRQNDFITLREELKFIENYFFLLQIRYRDAVSLSVCTGNEADNCLVLPLSLQILVENAIKHNELTKEDPMHITITAEKNALVVSNTLRSRGYETSSSRIGLKNLRARYKILASRDISVVKNKEQFVVRLPLLRNAKAYDVNSYHRG